MEHRSVPRIMLAGTGSGCGKTTVTCAVLQALTDRGVKVAACKCGPDYIDPMFHRRITGGRGANLDLHFFPEDTVRYLLAKNAGGRDLAVVEGVMGYYDGLGLTSAAASSYAVARATDTPTVLVLDARGASLSLLATIQGFLTFQPDSGIRGVILNRCAPMVYPALAAAIEERFGIRALGYLPKMEHCALESRHLGLVTAAEVADLDHKRALLSRQAQKTIDLDGLIGLARQAPELTFQPMTFSKREPVRIAVARDKAFCFYYEDSLEVLEELGAELVSFSPLEDEALPENIQGLYLGGGYPELYAQTLSENRPMLESVRQAVAGGLPCIAECGGFMYLTQAIGEWPMVGALPGTCFDTGRLTRFGYITLRAGREGLLCRAGESVAAHEFHHWDCTVPGDAFVAEKANGRAWPCAVMTDTLYAGFPHFHFCANPAFAERFYQACVKEKHRL